MKNRMKYFFELYNPLPRGGPGDNESTRKAYRMITGLPAEPKILDLGCGPGMQTLELARLSKGEILALDNHQPFLDKLDRDAARAGLSRCIKTVNRDMNEMDFSAGVFDLIWSEGALYFMGFETGLKKCGGLLKPGSHLAATELVWLKKNPTPAAREFAEEYPAIKDVPGNLRLFKQNDYEMIGHFTLPVSAWLEEYYAPLRKRIDELRPKWKGRKGAVAVLDASQAEIDTYKKCADQVGYEFFVARAKRS